MKNMNKKLHETQKREGVCLDEGWWRNIWSRQKKLLPCFFCIPIVPNEAGRYCFHKIICEFEVGHILLSKVATSSRIEADYEENVGLWSREEMEDWIEALPTTASRRLHTPLLPFFQKGYYSNNIFSNQPSNHIMECLLHNLFFFCSYITIQLHSFQASLSSTNCFKRKRASDLGHD